MLITSQLPQEYANKSMKMHANGKKLSCVLSRSQLVVTVPMFPTKEKRPAKPCFFRRSFWYLDLKAWRMQPCMLPWKLTAARPWKMMLFQDHFPFEEMVPLKRGYVNFVVVNWKVQLHMLPSLKPTNFHLKMMLRRWMFLLGLLLFVSRRVYEHSKPCYPLGN